MFRYAHSYLGQREAAEEVAQDVYLVAFGVVAGVALFLAFGHFLKWLWAVTVADIFGWREISFWRPGVSCPLSQILLKANFTSSAGRSRRAARSDSHEAPAP